MLFYHPNTTTTLIGQQLKAEDLSNTKPESTRIEDDMGSYMESLLVESYYI